MNNNLGKKVVASAILTSMLATGAKGESLPDQLMNTDLGKQNIEIQYLENVKNANLDEFDINFVLFYRNGIVSINDEEYQINRLFIETGYDDNNDFYTCLVSSTKQTVDLISNSTKPITKRESVKPFKNTIFCYDVFSSNDFNIEDNILTINTDLNEILLNSSIEDHDLVPETFYLKEGSVSNKRN